MKEMREWVAGAIEKPYFHVRHLIFSKEEEFCFYLCRAIGIGLPFLGLAMLLAACGIMAWKRYF